MEQDSNSAFGAPPETLEEPQLTLLGEGFSCEGTLEVEGRARVHGTIRGTLIGKKGSSIVIGETGFIEGQVLADEILVNGTVRGKLHATGKIRISGTGRVIGDIRAPALGIECGAYFEGSSELASSSMTDPV
jgi:cytoskeletal protein CcmA (bactofilin family)